MNSATPTMVVPPTSGPDARLDPGAEEFGLVVGGRIGTRADRPDASGDRSPSAHRCPVRTGNRAGADIDARVDAVD
ncbi:MAG TPA: hypothetical protein VEZ42_03500, partial [Pseudonocardia sp.]|nr:hypothetical protein [Pseudonocardia sp.]